MLAKVLLTSVLVAVVVDPKVTEGNVECLHFRCLNGRCVNRKYFCDQSDDCGDNSDEKFCGTKLFFTTCPMSWFLCGNGRRCIPSEWRCNGLTECPDGTDEVGCDGKIYSFPGVPDAIRNLTQKFKETRKDSRSINKWGLHVPRTAVALFLADSNFFAPSHRIGDEITYDLSLKLMSKLALKEKISTQELSLFINALKVSCVNPKDFFGVDLVAELRTRVSRSNYTNPFFILTLCNAGDSMTLTDVLNVNSTFYARLRPLWTDIQALATMAMACMSSQKNLKVDEEILKEMVEELKRKQSRNGTIGNLKTTATVMQALISTNSYLTGFDMRGALNYVLEELKSPSVTIQNMYYILPLLKTKSLVDINAKHCAVPVKTDLQELKKIREHPEEGFQSRVSVFFGDEMEFVRNWQLRVPPSYNLYQVLERIGSTEPAYKFHYSFSEDQKPYVAGVSKFFDDAEDGMFWFIYTKDLKNDTKPKLVVKSPVDIQLNEDKELILWYRSEVWADPQ